MEPKAAPPDDGGEQGAFTRPEDTLVQPNPPAEGRPIVREPSPAKAGRGLLAPWLIFIAVLFLAILFVYLIVPLSSSRDSNERPTATEGRD